MGNGFNVNRSNPTYLRVGRSKQAIIFSLPIHAFNISETATSIVNVTQDDTAVEAIIEDEWHENRADKHDKLLDSSAIDLLKQLVLEINQQSNWDLRLLNYIWKSRTFFQTQNDLADLIWQGSIFARMILANTQWTDRDNLAVVKWAEAIFEWGGTRQRQTITADKVKKTLENAVKNCICHQSAPMNSGYTKVASFGTAYLEENGNKCIPQVINDSRVATSLTHRLDSILSNRNLNPTVVFPMLGKVEAARGGTRPRPLKLNWPNAYQSWSGQFAATEVVAKIRDILNDPSLNLPEMPCAEGEETSCWTMRGVEAVLFMDGY